MSREVLEQEKVMAAVVTETITNYLNIEKEISPSDCDLEFIANRWGKRARSRG